MNIKGLFSSENKEKIKNLIYSIAGVAIFNMVIQFFIYPQIEKTLGPEKNGIALSLISLIAIISGTCGYAVNSSRLLGLSHGRTNSGDYNIILLIMGTVCSGIGAVYLFWLDIATPISVILYILLIVATMLRYYSDVEFRININFFRYMIYYILISVGYIVGLVFLKLSGEWMLTLLLGELFAVIYVVICGKIYRPPFFKKTEAFAPAFTSISFLFLSSLIDNLTLHADRILLLAITGAGTAVTTYYIASLVGKLVALLTVPINSLIISYMVKYKGALSKKLWTLMVGGSAVFGAVAFVGCMIVSPFLIKILYPDNYAEASKYLVGAVLGQIFYFVSGVLMTALLKFKGEKRQFIFNVSYAVIFFAAVILGTSLYSLEGFVYAVLIANAIRFVGAAAWGFIGKKE